jgi:gluconolactonase
MKMNHTVINTLLLSCAGITILAEDFEIKDATEARKIIVEGAKIEKVLGGLQFTEGPVWMPADGGCLIFSDIPANELKKWNLAGGLTTIRKPSGNANGNTLDLQGRLITAEHSGRRLSITEKNGTVSSLVETHNGKRFNSPNDVVVKSDGTIWFTDPPYGLGQGALKEQPGNYVFRYDPAVKQSTIVATDFDMPNGLCFSPDEKKLYIADSGKPRHIRVFDVKLDGTLSGGSVFCRIDQGSPDGIRCDRDGRVWSSSGNGVQVFSVEGTLVLKINLPEAGANLCFGGQDGKTVLVTARTSLYAVATRVTGLGNRSP